MQQEVQQRFLCPEDVAYVKILCKKWFPIEYPDSWYNNITSNHRFYSLAAIHQTCIIGFIVAELKPISKLSKEDNDILAPYYRSSIQVAYILSLGVEEDFRRHGIASMLLDCLLSYLASAEQADYYISHCSQQVSKMQPCRLPRHVYRLVRGMIRRFLSCRPIRASHYR